MIQVVTVYTPRPGHEKFLDFEPLLRWQKATAEKFGHKHVVVSDAPIDGFNNFKCHDMTVSLMLSIMRGQLAYLEAWDGNDPVVLVDGDCVVSRDLTSAFDGSFDIGLTNRDNPVAPINNGAMYVSPGNKELVVSFFKHALSMCKKHWGGDQEAISMAAAPVPRDHRVIVREDGLRISFLSMMTHNVVPRVFGVKHKHNPYIVHFKGVERKPWMEFYAKHYVLGIA